MNKFISYLLSKYASIEGNWLCSTFSYCYKTTQIFEKNTLISLIKGINTIINISYELKPGVEEIYESGECTVRKSLQIRVISAN
jgi:hypothetical protein